MYNRYNQLEPYLIKRTQEHGVDTGISAQYYKKFGATDEQIKAYIIRGSHSIPAEYRPAYFASARKAYAKPSNKLDHPIYNLYVKRMKENIELWNRQTGA